MGFIIPRFRPASRIDDGIALPDTMAWLRGRTILMLAALAVEGVLLLRPDGTLVQAAQQNRARTSDPQASWWRNSPVHMGCSIPSCTRPATRTATYRLVNLRGSTWRAYGFCAAHEPPATVDGLVYRIGRPPSWSYDVPLTPFWSEVYFLLGIAAFGVWCAMMWTYVRSELSAARAGGLLLIHVVSIAALWIY